MAKSIMLYYISRYFIFSQPEANYTIEGIILMDTLIATHCMKYIYSDFLNQARASHRPARLVS